MNRQYWIRNRLPRSFYQVVGHRRLAQWKELIYGEDAFLTGLVTLTSTIAALIFGFAVLGVLLDK